MEHPDPVALGGSDEDEDLWPAHEKCRRVKDKKDMQNITARDSAIDHSYAGEKSKKKRRWPKRKDAWGRKWLDSLERKT